MKPPGEIYPNDSFISVVIPTYCRPQYLSKALDTLEEFADMPYEVVVHDDGSSSEFREEVFGMSDRISTTIFNNGGNAGLCTSANRCVSVAHSKYILFLNDDCFFIRKCLKDICNVLSKSYVGLISVMNDVGCISDEDVCEVAGTRFSISSSLGGGATIAFRKEVWEEVGEFEERSPSSQADNTFIYKILKAGYWKAVLEGRDRILVAQFVDAASYIPTQPFTDGRDCSIPKIFGIPKQVRQQLSDRRKEVCYYWVEGQRTIPNRASYDGRPNPVAGLNDHPYWGDYFLDIFGHKHSNSAKEIVWDVAERHGQSKWRKDIEQDFGL